MRNETKIGCVNHDCDKCKAQQEPVAWGNLANWCLDSDRVLITDKDDAAKYHRDVYDLTPLYTTPQAQPAREPLTEWIDPNDKTQKQYLPGIGAPVLFCHGGKTYYGRHTGGSFQYGAGVTSRHFNTWECRWMPLPSAHGITKGST